MSDERKERCETCRFWHREINCEFVTVADYENHPAVKAGDIEAEEFVETINQGDCRRYPPQMIVWPETESADVSCDERFPHTQPHEWCGEWKPLEG